MLNPKEAQHITGAVLLQILVDSGLAEGDKAGLLVCPIVHMLHSRKLACAYQGVCHSPQTVGSKQHQAGQQQGTGPALRTRPVAPLVCCHPPAAGPQLAGLSLHLLTPAAQQVVTHID